MEQVVNIRTMVEPMTHRYIVNLDRPITAPSDFQEEILTINSAMEGDVVHIYINSEGGELRTAKAILGAMHQSQAHIVTEITGECASAATLIFLAGHEYRVSDDAEFMIHTCSYGSVGKENNVRQHVDFVARVTGNLIRKYYKHFLNEEELELCIEGKDFWMDCDEVMERLEKRQALFQAETPEDVTDDVEEAVLKQLEGMFEVPDREFFEGWDTEKLISYICDDDFESKYPDVGDLLEESLEKVDSLSVEDFKEILEDSGYEDTFPENSTEKVVDELNKK